MIKTSILIAVV